MTSSSSHGRHDRPEPLRKASRAESAQARRDLRTWRTKKYAMVLAGVPIVAIALAGYALASPGRWHHHQPTSAACATASATAGQSSTSTTAAAGGTTSSSAASPSSTSAVSASATGTTAGTSTGTGTASSGTTMSTTATTAAGTGTTTTAAGTGTSTTAAAGTGTTTTTAAGTGTSTTAASTTAAATTGATCANTTAAATTTASATATTVAAATPNPNCTLVVPANPLSAQGLATPYQFVATNAAMGACHEANVNQSAFVQATIYDPATGALSVYDPLVIDQGTTAAAAPVVPTLPAGAVVGIWFGFNATNLTLQDSGGSLASGNCVNGLGASVFGQFADCNAAAFFSAVNQGIAAGKVTVPNPGTAVDGQPCLTTRNFGLIDQDQSDNVTTSYLATANGQTAQNNAANMATLTGATTLANPSDNALLDVFVDPALHCTPWTAPNLGNGGAAATSIALDEIQANAFPANPTALVPENDPMALVNGAFSSQKTNLYRAGVDQSALPAGVSPAVYCGDMDSIQSARLQQDVNLLINQTSPSAAAASNLFTFLAMRLQQSFGNLNCQNFGLANPVSSLATNGAGVVVGAVFAQQTNAVTAGAGNPAEKCVTITNATAQAACALAAVGANTSPTPTPTMTATPRPSGDMHHRSGHHW
ncbi:hypothetical protein KDK95_12225 [Actinospica sp. MGRD01-02]|uniref:Uncharacterized protein n=1 Tax=Actinospica acidithermotolerans TaxID=2828514 RepID=A0A941E664_9ACTN|nr:hypothetical protein [Actinospica acidithermotolerans]MBR7827075.1 hypothetical protein [Actinospica acidithermotolerans]